MRQHVGHVIHQILRRGAPDRLASHQDRVEIARELRRHLSPGFAQHALGSVPFDAERKFMATLHRERGFADVSDWMARATGSTAGSAKAALETAAALESRPEVKAALDSGELACRHRRSFARHLSLTDPAHQTELERLRGARRRGVDVEVELRPIARYDALIPA